MKTKILTAVLLTAGLSSTAMAADTYSLAVSAQVLGKCKFTQLAGATLTLTNTVGGIDPSLGTDATGSANITYRCTTGQAPTFTTDTGAHVSGGSMRVADGAGNFMVYTLALTSGGAGAGFGAGSDKTLAVGGTILAANNAAAAAGTYTDTVVVSVNP